MVFVGTLERGMNRPAAWPQARKHLSLDMDTSVHSSQIPLQGCAHPLTVSEAA